MTVNGVCPGTWFKEYFSLSFRADENVNSHRGLERAFTYQTVKSTIRGFFIYLNLFCEVEEESTVCAWKKIGYIAVNYGVSEFIHMMTDDSR